MAKKEIVPSEKQEVLMNLTPEDVMKRISKIKDVGNTIAFELGVLLKRVRDEQMWKNWEGEEYPSFAEWVFKVLGKNIRTAQYYIEVNEKLMALKLDDEWLRKAIQLGWVKLLTILKVANSKASFKKWYAKALNQGERSLKADVQVELKELPSEADESFDEGEVDPNKIEVHVQFKSSEEWEHFNKAMELAEKVTGNKHNGKLLDHMATYYMAHANTHMQGGPLMDIQDILIGLKETYGLELAIRHPETKKWIPVKREEEPDEPEEAEEAAPSKKPAKKSPAKSSAPKKKSAAKKSPQKKSPPKKKKKAAA